MTTFSEMSIPVLSIIIQGLELVKNACDLRLQELEKEMPDDSTMFDAVRKFKSVVELLAVARTEFHLLTKE